MSTITVAPSVIAAVTRSTIAAPKAPSTLMIGADAVFENDHYRVACSDDGAVTIVNRSTDEIYRVWGGLPLAGDAGRGMQFFGKTEIGLDDGTRVMIDTAAALGDASNIQPSQVTITSGTYVVRIHGVDANAAGDLRIEELPPGEVIAELIDDGVLQDALVGDILSGDSPIVDPMIDLIKELMRVFNGLFYLQIFGMAHLHSALHPWADALRANDNDHWRANDNDHMSRMKLRLIKQIVTPTTIVNAAPGETMTPEMRAPNEVELDILLVRQMLPG
jgi:hypothetical protein